MIFDNPFYKKGPVLTIGHFGARDDRIIRIRKFYDKIGHLRLLRPVRLQRFILMI
jgi:hypothetical protein